MKARVQFLGNNKWFNKVELEKYWHGFIIAQAVSAKTDYILYASHNYPGHSELIKYFLRHYKDYTILGGWSIAYNEWNMAMYPITSTAGYIPMIVSKILIPILEKKLAAIGVVGWIRLESHEDQVKEVIRELSQDWEKHIVNFENTTSPEK